jgi:micrococcal nuclease
MRIWFFVLAAVALMTPSLAAAPSCAGDIEIGTAHIVRIEKNGVLVMTDGRALKLEGIRLPAGSQDHAPQAIADRAFAELESLARGGALDARAVWPKEDRYDRVRSQIFTRDGVWLQLDLVQKGLARVELLPDRGECNRELYAAEAEARKAGLGLWADPAYATRLIEQLGPDIGTFQIVVGRVVRAAVHPQGGVFLNFGADWKRDFTVSISAGDVKTFKTMGVDPLNYEGKLIRVRGVVQAMGGPVIAVGNPKQIELLQ